MRELFFKLFESSHFDTGIAITPFSISHIVYLVLIFGGIIATYFLLKDKEVCKKEKAVRILAYAVVILYISDFFFHEFVYGGLNKDKLPFHICTALCPLVAFAQFNKKGYKIKEPIAMLSVIAPIMYLCYPASVGTGEPWCYQALQTMLYHGALMAWGILSICFGFVKPDLKKCYTSAILLVAITLWAKLGNVLFTSESWQPSWFFLEEDAFYIGFVENGIIPKWSLMIINPAVFFLAVLGVYGVCYVVKVLKQKAQNKISE